MIILLIGKFPERWETHQIFMAAGIEMLFIDAPVLGYLAGCALRMLQNG